MAYEKQGRALEWDDYIEHDGSDYILLPDGDYDFEVIDLTKSRHGGSEKLPPCNKVSMKLKIDTPAGVTIINHHLFLHENVEFRLCAFFKAIGQRQKDEKYKMNWEKVVGSKGRANVSSRKYTDNGVERETNQIEKFYDAPTKKFKEGVF
jgi:hypothetical protein